MIVLAFSSYLEVEHEHFKDYHKPWTGFLLSKQEFPFNKVIFASLQRHSAVVVYNKELPQLTEPKTDSEKELGITMASGSIVPFGKTVNYQDFFNKEPLVSPIKNRNKAIKERKAKRKTQKKARSIVDPIVKTIIS